MVKTFKIKYYFLLITSIIIFNCHHSLGQNKTEDVIYLKDGGTIGGTITENIPTKSITIKTRHGSTLVIKYDDIIKVTKEAYVDDVPPPSAMKYTYKEVKTSGIRFNIELNQYVAHGSLSYPVPSQYNPSSSNGIKLLIGNQATANVIVGLGLGIDQYNKSNLYPITLDLRSSMADAKFSPYINLFGGHSISNEILSGGITFGGAMGIKVNLSPEIAYTLGLAVKWQKSDYFGQYNLLRYIGYNTGFTF